MKTLKEKILTYSTKVKGSTMRVEIKNGKINGWIKISEAADICYVSQTTMRKLVRSFSDKDKFKLYGTTFVRETAVNKLCK